jgi:predicted ferric reductase
MHFLDILTILLTVSMLGTEFAVSAILNPAFEKLDRTTWLQTMPLLAKTMGRAMPFWYALGLVFIGVEGYLHFDDPARWWLITAVLLWIAAIVYSVTVLVPINNRVAEASTGAATAAEHKHWDHLHRWRVVLLLAATSCLLWGIA